MNSLILYSAADIIVLSLVIAFTYRKLTFWHPLTAYIFFHIYSFTTRLIAIITGARVMYQDRPDVYDAVLPEEFERAMMWADVALILYAIGAMLAHHQGQKNKNKPRISKQLSRGAINVISAICLPIGVVVLYILKAEVNISADITGTSYFIVIAMWPISCLQMLTFYYGLRWYLVIPISIYLFFVGVQGYHRFMLMLPLLFFTAYLLQANRQKWPGVKIILGGIFLLLIFPNLKFIGRAFQSGDYSGAIGIIQESVIKSEDVKEKEGGEQFLDQYAGSLTMIDEAGKFYHGSTYAALVTLPIPRSWWSNKPGLADHLVEISTSRRQYSIEGRIITYLGEAYLNFGYFGLFLVPLLLGFLLTRWCLAATGGQMHRLGCYIYTVCFVTLIQVYRDGLTSLAVFSIVHNLPVLFIWILHLFPPIGRKVDDSAMLNVKFKQTT